MKSLAIELFYLFFQGVLLFQVIFFGMIYYLFRKKELLYYSAMNLVTAFYFFLNAPETFFGIHEVDVFNSKYYDYLNYTLILAMTYLYLIFIKTIFDDKLHDRTLRILYKSTLYLFPLLFILFSLCTELGFSTNFVFFTGHIVNGPFMTAAIIKNIRIKGHKSLIKNGMIILLVFVVITAIMNIRYNIGTHDNIFDYYPLLFIRFGMLIDIILFQLALLQNWYDQEKELLLEKVESQLISERIRSKISSELHDDLGASLSGISMYSHLIKSQVEKSNPVVLNSANTIQTTADDMVSKLSDIVWLTNPLQDNLHKLIQRIEEYANQMVIAKGIKLKTIISPDLPDFQLSIDTRRNIYLICKEAINNAVKYSNGTELLFDIRPVNHKLAIKIQDNGKGFDMNAVNGNGIQNMKNRAKAIEANLDLESGTTGSKVLVNMKI